MMATLMVARFMVVIAFMRVRMNGPGGKRIDEVLPGFLASRHFRVGEQARVELCPESVRIAIESHASNSLAPIAEWFSHFLVRSGISVRGA